jgi:glucose-like phosphotransferase system IIB component
MYDKSMEVIHAYGGPDNIKNIDACITKLRVQVKNKKDVDVERLKLLGALGITHPSPESVYAVFGTDADIIKNNMKDIIAKGLYTHNKKEVQQIVREKTKKEISEEKK